MAAHRADNGGGCDTDGTDCLPLREAVDGDGVDYLVPAFAKNQGNSSSPSQIRRPRPIRPPPFPLLAFK